ncbi:hypothetical protein E6C72_31505 (plasmid) [Azospirillum sp. TSH100]|nr:hypothetical protein E6C72_31505 [Azospirillum sp. TSH100]
MAAATADWPRASIKARVIESGKTLREISVDAGLHPQAASIALRRPWRAAQEAVAAAIGERPETIWPSRYSAEVKEEECENGTNHRTRCARIAAPGAPPSGRDRSRLSTGRLCTDAETRTASTSSSPASPRSGKSGRRNGRTQKS